MIKRSKKKIIALGIIATSVLALNPIGASAAWRQSSMGWWYTESNSWATGWKLIDGNWYYFYSDGYMAHDTTINGYYLSSGGAWTNSVITLSQAEEILKSNPKTSIPLSYQGASYVYTPNDNYVDSSLKDKYYVFTYTSAAGDEADSNICVDKKTGEIYIVRAGESIQILK